MIGAWWRLERHAGVQGTAADVYVCVCVCVCVCMCVCVCANSNKNYSNGECMRKFVYTNYSPVHL